MCAAPSALWQAYPCPIPCAHEHHDRATMRCGWPHMTSAAALRQQRYRERQRAGIRVVEIQVGPNLIDRMIDTGALKPSEIENAESLARAVVELIETALSVGLDRVRKKSRYA